MTGLHIRLESIKYLLLLIIISPNALFSQYLPPGIHIKGRNFTGKKEIVRQVDIGVSNQFYTHYKDHLTKNIPVNSSSFFIGEPTGLSSQNIYTPIGHKYKTNIQMFCLNYSQGVRYYYSDLKYCLLKFISGINFGVNRERDVETKKKIDYGILNFHLQGRLDYKWFGLGFGFRGGYYAPSEISYWSFREVAGDHKSQFNLFPSYYFRI